MKILLTTHQFFPQFTAGTEVLVNSVARELIKLGHDVRVLTGNPNSSELDDSARCDEYVYEGVNVYRFHHDYVPMGMQLSMIEIGYDNHLADSYFRRILESFKPDIVHFFHLNRLGTGLIDSAVLAGIPAYMTPTDFWSICPTGQLMFSYGSLCNGPSRNSGNCLKHFAQNRKSKFVQNLIAQIPDTVADTLVLLTQKKLMPPFPQCHEVNAIGSRLKTNLARLNKLSGILAPNKFMAELFVRYGVVLRLIEVSEFGIDVVDDSKNVYRTKAGTPLRVGYIGTLIKHKGCHVLIQAINELSNGVASLKIYGNTEENFEYSKQLKQLSNDSNLIEFCGTFENGKIDEVISDFDVLVVPSLWYENNPLVVYSAQAAKCPVIASNQPGISSVIKDGINGLLFEAGNSKQLAMLLERIASEENLLARLSSNAIPPKSLKTYVNELLNLWNENSC